MAFGKKAPQAPVVPPTLEELIHHHQEKAEDHLRRANKAGRLDAQDVHANRAVAYATLAMSYQLQLAAGGTESPTRLPYSDDESDEEMDDESDDESGEIDDGQHQPAVVDTRPPPLCRLIRPDGGRRAMVSGTPLNTTQTTWLPVMSDIGENPDCWEASDGKW